MKNCLLLLVFCFPVLLHAQLTSENFDSFNTGSFDSQWDAAQWVGWYGGASGVAISDNYANSGSNSMQIEANDDIIALLGSLNSGIYEIAFQQYIAAADGAYFNLQHNYTNSGADWAVEVYFMDAAGGLGTIVTEGVGYTFDIVHDAWAENKFVINFNQQTAEFYYNGTLAHSWPINTQASGGPGLNQINGINFFGACGEPGATNCSSLAYYDDVSVTAVPLPDYDAFLGSITNPLEYTIVPESLAKPMVLEATVQNGGMNPITNVSVTFEVKDATGTVVHTETSDPMASIDTEANGTFTGSNGFMPVSGNAYTVDYTINIDETDDVLSNNTLTSSTYVYVNNPLLYARDDGSYTGGIGFNNGTIYLGHNYDFSEPTAIKSIAVSSGGGAVGDLVIGYIFTANADNSPNTLIAASNDFNITQAGSGNGGEVAFELEFPSPVLLDAGNYVFVVEQAGTTNLGVSTSAAIYTPNTAWASTDSGANWVTLESAGFPVALSIRPNLAWAVAVETPNDYVNSFSISPNPTKGEFVMDIALTEAQKIVMEVYNTQGQLLQSRTEAPTLGGQYNMDLSDLPASVYFVKCQIGTQILTSQVVLMK